MKRNPLFYASSAMLAVALLYLWSTLAPAQEITKATPDSDSAGIVILVVGLALAGGAVFVRLKKPDLWAKLTRTAGQANQVVHRELVEFKSIVDSVPQASKLLHVFEAHEAPAAPPAISITPTHPVIQEIARESAQLNKEMHDNIVMVSPPAYVPTIVNGRIV